MYSDAAVERSLALIKAGRTFDYGRGEEIAELEDRFATLHGREYALALNSGTSALLVAYLALGVRRGVEVVVPTFTYLATATPLLTLQATPVLADSGSPGGMVTAASIEAALTPRTHGIAVTHLYGHPCDMRPILRLARDRGLFLLEDCSHAHGAVSPDGRRVGTWGDVAIFSVGSRKLVSGGMGGVLLTDSQGVHDVACLASAPERRSAISIRDPELSPIADVGLGGNLRMAPPAAVLAVSHLVELDRLIQEKAANVEALLGRLEALPGLQRVPVAEGADPGARYGVHVSYDEEVTGIDKARAIAELTAAGLRVGGPQATPLHLKSVFASPEAGAQVQRLTGASVPQYRKGELPYSERLADAWLRLPADYLHGDASALVERYAAAFEHIWERWSLP